MRVTNDDALDIARAWRPRRGCWSAFPPAPRSRRPLEQARRPANAGRMIVVIIPSFGERYLSTVLYQHLEV